MESALPEPEPVSTRLFGVIPNYRASDMLETYKPLTTAEKYHMAFQDSFDWPNFFLLAGYAAQSQVAAGGFHHNGGLPVFGEYYARGFSDQIIGSYVTDAIMPTLLHEDPRCFRMGTGSFGRRIYYAASRIFVTRLDNGKSRFNITEVAGNMGIDAITTWYYPESQTAAKGAERFGMQLGNDAISNILTEFWPDIKHRLRPLCNIVCSLAKHWDSACDRIMRPSHIGPPEWILSMTTPHSAIDTRAAVFIRWRIPVGAVAVHICIGSVYAWSTFNRPIHAIFPQRPVVV